MLFDSPSRHLTSLSIRAQLALLVALVALPMVGLIAWSGLQGRQEAVARARVQTQRLADSLVAEQQAVVAGAQQLFYVLAQLPEVRARDPRVRPLLVELLRLNPEFLNIVLADREGTVWAWAAGTGGATVGDRRYFRNAIASGRLSSGEYAISRSQSQPVFHLGYPFRDGRGEVAGVIAVSVSLDTFRSILRRAQLPAGASYALLDHRGVVLSRGIDQDRYLGKPYDRARFDAMVAGPDSQSTVEPGLDERMRVASFRKLRLPGEMEPYLYVRAGIPLDVVEREATATLARDLAISLALLAAAVAAALLVGNRAFVDRISILEAASRRLADGDLEVRVSELVQGGELGSLGRSFDRMAAQLAARKEADELNRELQARLLQAQKLEAVGRLAGGVAHDINNMLSVILGEAELLQADLPPGNPAHVAAGEIRRACHRSRDITRQLLAFSRKQVARPRQVDPDVVVAETRQTLSRLVGEEYQLEFTPGAGGWMVHVDPVQLDQVLVNLVVNARDAMPGGGTVRIATTHVVLDGAACHGRPGRRPGEFVRLTVADHGIGMDAETLLHVFEPFFTRKEVGAGTGLGLATVYGIATQNGGFVEVDSEPGCGATFDVHLPRAVPAFIAPGRDEGAAATDEAPGGAAATAREPAAGTILLVEDEELVRRTAVRMLESLGYAVLAAATPAEALAHARVPARRIDLLLTDVVMPGMKGPELASQLVALRPGLPVVFMSGYTANAALAHGVPERGAGLLPKPFTRSDLAARVAEALGAPVA